MVVLGNKVECLPLALLWRGKGWGAPVLLPDECRHPGSLLSLCWPPRGEIFHIITDWGWGLYTKLPVISSGREGLGSLMTTPCVTSSDSTQKVASLPGSGRSPMPIKCPLTPSQQRLLPHCCGGRSRGPVWSPQHHMFSDLWLLTFFTRHCRKKGQRVGVCP